MFCNFMEIDPLNPLIENNKKVYKNIDDFMFLKNKV